MSWKALMYCSSSPSSTLAATPRPAMFRFTLSTYTSILNNDAGPVTTSASKRSIPKFVITEKAPSPYYGLLLVESGYYSFHI